MERIVIDNSSRAFELLRAGDAAGLQRLIDEDAKVVEARDANGVSSSDAVHLSRPARNRNADPGEKESAGHF
jgi:hypothetical protein